MVAHGTTITGTQLVEFRSYLRPGAAFNAIWGGVEVRWTLAPSAMARVALPSGVRM